MSYPKTETEREAMLEKHGLRLEREVKELKTSCEDYATQVNCLLKDLDEQHKKIYALEKILKIYL